MKNKVFIVIFGFVFLFLLVFLTWGWFTFNGPIPTGADLGKGDWLAFWGSVLTLIATGSLALVSFFENRNANRTNKKLTLQNAVSNFYSQIELTSLEVEVMKNVSPFLFPIDKKYYQCFQLSADSGECTSNYLILNLYFKNLRNFTPISFYTKLIRVITEYSTKNKEEFTLENNSKKYYSRVKWSGSGEFSSMSLSLQLRENEHISTAILESSEIILDSYIDYRNPFSIETHSRIYTMLKKSNKKNLKKMTFTVDKTYTVDFSCEYFEDVD